MIKVCIASNNKNKIKQFGEILSELGLDANVLTAKDVGMPDFPPEDAETFYGNSLIKAKALYEHIVRKDGSCGCYVVADDSGICVDALGGGPGVRSARFSGEHATDAENNKLLLEKLKGVENRAAHYMCVITLITPDGNIMCSGGRADGEVIDDARGTDGFGYDPYFYFRSLGKTFAELSSEVRNSISHRGQALRKTARLIEADLANKKKS